MFLIYTKITRGLIFKGGTCLWKIFRGKRFSEDLDFESEKVINPIGQLTALIRDFGFDVMTIKEKITERSLYSRLEVSSKILGRVPVAIEITFGRKRKWQEIEYISPYPIIPRFDILVLSKEIIALDKLDAIINRNKARDVYDLFMLLKEGVTVKFEDCQLLEKKIMEKESNWRSLSFFVIGKLPQFKDVAEYILRIIC
ncbi:MAG: nucleotidyl transferase AbiEii/AbiGii toxin family protein [Candidatus Asgardarchaeia archaeon]